jgi:pimeloyl-ACP methyl ester carboxylesterase
MLNEHQLDIGDATINYVETGDGPPLVLLHGLTQTWRVWAEELGLLAHRWRVFAPDARGHGGSSRSQPALYNFGTWVSDTAKLIEAVTTEPVVVVGFSMGGMIATGLAGIHPSMVRAAILVEPGWLTAEQKSPEERRTWNDLFDAWRSIVRQHRDRHSLQTALEDLRTGQDAVQIRSVACNYVMLDPEVFSASLDDSTYSGIDLEDAMNTIECPVLLIQGNPSLGGVLTDDRAEQMTNAIADCTHIKFDDAGHGILNDQPVRFRQALFRFLSTI